MRDGWGEALFYIVIGLAPIIIIIIIFAAPNDLSLSFFLSFLVICTKHEGAELKDAICRRVCIQCQGLTPCTSRTYRLM